VGGAQVNETIDPLGDSQDESSAQSRSEDLDKAIEQRIRAHYGRVLSEDEIREFCLFEQARPNWRAWPHVGWATGTHIIYARREFSVMNVIVAETMDDLAGKVDEWIAGRDP
jgi:hypothetical protein